MAKQKVVVKVTMKNTKKTQKAMKVAVSVPGVESVAFVGPDKEQITVTGEGIDSVQLAKLLRKKVGFAELVSVGLIEEKKPAKPTLPASQTEIKDIQVRVNYPYPQPCFCHSFPFQVVHENPFYSCTIM